MRKTSEPAGGWLVVKSAQPARLLATAVPSPARIRLRVLEGMDPGPELWPKKVSNSLERGAQQNRTESVYVLVVDTIMSRTTVGPDVHPLSDSVNILNRTNDRKA